MVDHEAELRHRPDDLQGRWELAGPDEQVVGQPGARDRRQATPDLGADEPVRVGFIVDRMSDPDEERATRAGSQRGDGLDDRRIRQVDPANDAGHELGRRRGRQELPGFLEARAGLHEDRSADLGLDQQRRKVVRAEATGDRPLLSGHPRVVSPGRVPEMVVSIDREVAHGGVGASAGMRASLRSSAHRSAGIAVRMRAG